MANKLEELKNMMNRLGLRDENRTEYVTRPEDRLAPSVQADDEPEEQPNEILERANAPKENREEELQRLTTDLNKFNETNQKVADSTAAIGELREFERQQEQNKDDKKRQKPAAKEPKVDEELRQAELQDTISDIAGDFDKAFARLGAANVAYQAGTDGRPIESGIEYDEDAVEELLKRRQDESRQKSERFKNLMNQMYKKAMIDQMEGRQKAREEELDLRKAQIEGQAQRRKEEREFKREQEERRLTKQERRASEKIYNVVKDFESDPLNKELKKQGLSFGQADSLIESMEEGNEVALGALGTKMARAMGEVGVLTEQDVKRYIQAQSIVRSARDRFGRAFMGRISPETIKDIKEVTSKMKKGFNKKRQTVQDKYVNYAYQNFAKDAKIPKEEVMKRFGIDPEDLTSEQEEQEAVEGMAEYKPEQQTEAPYGEIVERGGKRYRWNPNVGKYQLVK